MRDYRSALASYISGLLRQKKACGYLYDSEAYVLESFDRFCLHEHHTVPTISRDLVMKWAVQRPNEGKNCRNQRVSIVRQLALYIHSLGKEVYIPRHFASETVAVPHVLTREELTAFYAAVDAYSPPQPAFRRLALTYRVLFRLYYCCGLRLAEGCYLQRRCVDLKRATITVLQSKGNKDRLVYLHEEVLAMCRQYDERMQSLAPDRKWFFPGWRVGGPIQKSSVDSRFTEFWNRTPFAGKVDKKPTVQCLRHTFVVERMNQWMRNGIDTAVMMPYLSRYLGHGSIFDTQYYYHSIEQAFPIVRSRDTAAERIIPEVVVYED
ncbi:MAG: tyrosine-type recombinase/integrase [Candidatus Thermoplasmatota archaeon]